MKYLGKAVNKTGRDRIRNESIREEEDQRSLQEIIEQRQLKQSGHAFRMADDSKIKHILEMKVQGRRVKGRPRIILQAIMERIGDKGKMRRMMRDRNEQRK